VSTLDEALDAADSLLAWLGKAAKPNPLARDGFDALVVALSRKLQRGPGTRAERRVREAAKRLDVDWTRLTPAQRTAAIDRAAKQILAIGRDAAPAIAVTFDRVAPSLVTSTKAALNRQHKLSIPASFEEADRRAMGFLAQSQANFARDAFGKRSARFSADARGIVAQGLEDGWDRNEIGEQLALKLAAAGRTDAYWRMISSVFTARSRTWSTLAGFQEAGIEAYEFQAVMDEVTSEPCRFMDGQRFPVARALRTIQQVEESPDPEAVKTLQPWLQTGRAPDGTQAVFFKSGDTKQVVATVDRPGFGQRDQAGQYTRQMSSGAMMRSGICTPPLHAHCRSVLVPIFGRSR
jgi:hypothetical protein